MPIPKRWLQYTKFGKQIPGTRFVALKCPLRKTICANLPEDLRFTPEIFLSELPSVAMLIDLTNTSRYYAPQELSGVSHVKVMCPGQQVPPAGVVNTFFDAVDSFLRSPKEGLIGVHCTHGVNRTGFLICKYLVSRMGFSPEQAVRVFNESRGHQMERKEYFKALKVPEEDLKTLLGQEPEDRRLERNYSQIREQPQQQQSRQRGSRDQRPPPDRQRPPADRRNHRPNIRSERVHPYSRDHGPPDNRRGQRDAGRRGGRDSRRPPYPSREFRPRPQQDWGRDHRRPDNRSQYEGGNLSRRREQQPEPDRRDERPRRNGSPWRKYQVLQ
ncbi:RNA/RNP complex-1-interacting phosphatase [Neocloeon triangulifer]|uniref:RNA/RNP complex-1-interacting phosphatase n=1 Tax=Neocloeon triangulifer TaxID=2078957 RepID=UPI00286EC6FA|nr:RNA/RNP complex-1-interacting phosphatase [Neocloeon triangulifer]